MSPRRVLAIAAAAGVSIACGQLLGIDGDDDGDRAPSTTGADASMADGAPSDDATTTTVDPAGDGGLDAADADAGPPRPRIVFVTGATMNGNFGGLTAGDALCTSEALDAGLPGAFVAWLSIGTGPVQVDAKARLTGDAGWSLVDGREVFAGPSAITGGSYPKVGIDKTARGQTVTGTVWTGTRETGARYDGSDCSQWTDPNSNGVDGVVGATDPSWTAAVNDYCNQPRRLICFQK